MTKEYKEIFDWITPVLYLTLFNAGQSLERVTLDMNLKPATSLNIGFAIAAFTILFSCQQTKHEHSMQGTWKMEGYGKIIQITDTVVDIYDTTRVSCLPAESLKLKDIGFLGHFKQIAQDSLVIRNGITDYLLIRTTGLPNRCSLDTVLNRNPIYNFDVFYHTLSENYAYFRERNVNWDSLYRISRTAINRHTSPAKLYQVMNKMLGSIHDGHTEIPLPKELGQIASAAVPAPGSSLKKIRDHVLYKNVRKPTVTGRDMDGRGLVNWGITKNNIGYMQVNGMICYLDFAIPDSVTGAGYWEQYTSHVFMEPDVQNKEAAMASRMISKALYELRNTKGIILDLRFNDGGFDAVSLQLLKHFVAAKTLIFYKQARAGKGLTRKQMIFVDPASPRYARPVILLTSNRTASAAEIFTMGTMSLTNFRRIGQKTKGILSDALPKRLPNGWEFTLSNEIYTTTGGQNLENIGIVPHVYSGAADLEALLISDAAFETAVKELSK